ncbi:MULTISPECIES: alpha/beta family hydrolase [Gammaproteobacteria]|uniref:Alpha/beta hydrolase n=1 Tax=Vreelandella halophila TaxID=86177 RepID=A0A9X5B4T0_9GAMM|nr:MULTISPECIES: alpha/beta family hydrolase [Gammaproteobacteria]KAA8984384.1 alpha/beta hydrolase [Halospina sp. K52047b]MYL26891.1 alpha/beta hydrolase [Halomonas utahensis]MYL74152.1 alpha/beta hydrolase [Halomonas sp. 22501_18_FS]
MDILFNGEQGPVLVLAHGSGAPADSVPMERLATALAAAGFRVRRFEFPFMAQRRTTGKRRPPDRPPVLLQVWREVIEEVGRREPDADHLWIGGRSLGGRTASMLLTPEQRPEPVSGALVFGYPFHPPRRPEQWRTDHFAELERPLWIAHGERDPFGKRSELEPRMPFPGPVHLEWVADGDHELMPTRRSGLDPERVLATAAESARAFVKATETDR